MNQNVWCGDKMVVGIDEEFAKKTSDNGQFLKDKLRQMMGPNGSKIVFYDELTDYELSILEDINGNKITLVAQSN